MTLEYLDKLKYEYDHTKPNLITENYQIILANQTKPNKPSL